MNKFVLVLSLINFQLLKVYKPSHSTAYQDCATDFPSACAMEYAGKGQPNQGKAIAVQEPLFLPQSMEMMWTGCLSGFLVKHANPTVLEQSIYIHPGVEFVEKFCTIFSKHLLQHINASRMKL